jgi:hypothetical protein
MPMGVRISSNLIVAAFLAVATILGDMQEVNCIADTILQLKHSLYCG